MIDVLKLTDRDGMLTIIASDADAEEAVDFSFVDDFNFLCEFKNNRIAWGESQAADNKDIIDGDAHNNIFTDVDIHVHFKGLKPHAYNNFW